MVTWLKYILLLLPFLPQQSLDEARARLDQARKQVSLEEETSKHPQVSVTWTESVVQQSTAPVKYLVSEPWCVYCPAAKKRFLAEGNPESHIINIATAKSQFGKIVTSVPYEFTTSNPTAYRSEWPPKWDVEGVKHPSKTQLLNHLRNNSNHRNKQWQQWHLESWSKEQLAALHSDDHDNVSFSVVASAEEKTIQVDIDSQPSVNYTFKIIEEYLQKESGDDSITYSSWFDFDVDVPDFIPNILNDLSTKNKWTNGSISLEWKEGWSVKNESGNLSFSPPITAKYQKGIFKFSCSLRSITIKNSGKSVTFDLSPSPDITINFR